MCNKNGVVTTTFFQVISSITNLWTYKVSLNDLSKLYAIFFRDVPMKLKIFVKNSSIIKLMIVPYNLFSNQLLGTTSSTDAMNLSARIFNVMAGSRK
jgi:hypothetical protein